MMTILMMIMMTLESTMVKIVMVVMTSTKAITRESAYRDGSGPNSMFAFQPRVSNQMEAFVAIHLM